MLSIKSEAKVKPEISGEYCGSLDAYGTSEWFWPFYATMVISFPGQASGASDGGCIANIRSYQRLRAEVED